MYLFDTDTLIHSHRDHPAARRRFDAIGNQPLAISVVTRIELLRVRFEHVMKAANALELKTAQHWLDEIDLRLSQWDVLPIDEAVSAEFERLRQVKSLRKIGRADLLIACIALAHTATLVTRNTRDFSQIPHLRLENWVD